MSGLAFAESVAFLTRAHRDQPVTRIVWDGPKLRKHILDNAQTERAIRECVCIETLSGKGYLDHFFEVDVGGVGRHAAGQMLNRESVRNYIGEVCPVPMNPTFPFASKIDNLFEGFMPQLELDVTLNDEVMHVTRQYGSIIRCSKDRKDHFTELEEIDIPSSDGNRSAAIGWIAHSSYLGAIPREAGIRGVRARVGNIQIGDETVFDRLFPEERFNRWCVGEVHIVDVRIVPNARRDYFEPGPHTRNLENQLGAVLRRVVARCRKASAARNKQRRLLSFVCQMEDTYDLAISGYLSPEDAKALVTEALNRISDVLDNIDSKKNHARPDIEKLRALGIKCENFRARRGRLAFGSISTSEVATYRKVFQALTEVSQSPRVAKKMMEAVLTHA